MPKFNWQRLDFNLGKIGLDLRVPSVAPNLSGYATALNGYFTVRSSFKTRPGLTAFGPSFANANPIDGIFDLWIEETAHYVIAIQSGIVWQYNFSNNTWTALSLVTPTAFTLAPATGTGLASGTYYYWITGANQQGETLSFGPLSIVLSAASDVLVSLAQGLALLGDWGWNVYRSTSATPGTAQRVYVSTLYTGLGGQSWTDTGVAGSSGLPLTDTAHLTAGQFVTFSLLDNQLAFGNGLDHNLLLNLVANTLTDLTVAQSLPPCQYWRSHGERIFASGNRKNPGATVEGSRVFWCGADNPADWTSSGNAGFVDVSKGKDVVCGLASFQSNLYIFKGPRYPQLLVLTGTAYDNFVLEPLYEGITGFHRTILNIGNDALFQSTDGVYSLSRVLSTGGYDVNSVRTSSALLPAFVSLPTSTIQNGCAVWYEPENIAVFYNNAGPGTLNLNTGYAVGPPQGSPDFTQGSYRWSEWAVPPMWSVAPYALDSNTYSSLVGMFDANGNAALFLWDYANDTDNGTNFSCQLQSPALYMNDPVSNKQIKNLALTFLTAGNLNVFLYDSNRIQVVAASAYNPAGGSDNWTTSGSVWSSGGEEWLNEVPQFSNIPCVGASRSFTISIEKVSNAFELFDGFLYFIPGGAALL